MNKFKHWLIISAISSYTAISFADSESVTLTFDHPQILSVSTPLNNDIVSRSGVVRTSRWIVKSNNTIEVKFSGSTPGQEFSVPIFYKQELNARGELLSNRYDYLETHFGAMITDYDSAEKVDKDSISNRAIFDLKVDGDNDTFDSTLYAELSAADINNIKKDAAHNRYGYIHRDSVTRRGQLKGTYEDKAYTSLLENNSNSYGEYQASDSGTYIDKNGSYQETNQYTNGDRILSNNGYKSASTERVEYDKCYSYGPNPDPSAESGSIICIDLRTESYRTTDTMTSGQFKNQDGEHSTVKKFERSEFSDAGRLQLQKDLIENRYGQEAWAEDMNDGDRIGYYSKKSIEGYSYNYWGRSHTEILGTPLELVSDNNSPNGKWGAIMPNDDGHFVLSLYSQGQVQLAGTQSGLYSMTVALNVTAKEQL